MHDALARQVLGQRPAGGFAVLPRVAAGRCGRGCEWPFDLSRHLVLRHARLELGQLQLQLVNELGAALRGSPELVTPQLGEGELESLDLQPTIVGLLLGDNHHRLQRGDVIGQLRGIERHGREHNCFAPISSSHASIIHRGASRWPHPHSAGKLGTPGLLWCPPIDAFEQVAELCR